jgi:hypothetical protein
MFLAVILGHFCILALIKISHYALNKQFRRDTLNIKTAIK